MLRWPAPSIRVLDGSRKPFGLARTYAFKHSTSSIANGRVKRPDTSATDGPSTKRSQLGAESPGAIANRPDELLDASIAARHGANTRLLHSVNPTEGSQPIGSNAAMPSPVAANSTLNYTSTHAHTHESSNALASLRAFLSTPMPCPPSVRLPTANTVKSWYTSIKATNQLSKLSDVGFSALIAIFGTLSIVESGRPNPGSYFLHPLALHIPIPCPRTYWAFVFRVIRDKQSLDRALSNSDRFWLMRGELANAAISDSPDEALVRAGTEYRYFHLHTADEEVHGPYLQALIHSGTERHLMEAVEHISRLLAHQNACDPIVVPLLRRIMTRLEVQLPPLLKNFILHALWHRMAQPAEQDAQDAPPLSQSLPAQKSTSFQMHSLLAPIVGVLQPTLFNNLEPAENHLARTDLKPWATAALQNLLNPDSFSIDERWRSMVSIIVATDPQATFRDIMDLCPTLVPSTTPDIDDMFILCALRTIETASGEEVTAPWERGQSLHEFTRTLWQIWDGGERGMDALTPQLQRDVLATFINVASAQGDNELVEHVLAHCHHRGVWSHAEVEAGDADELAVQVLVLIATTGRSVADIKGQMGSACTPAVLEEATSRVFRSDMGAAHRICGPPELVPSAHSADVFANVAKRHYARAHRATRVRSEQQEHPTQEARLLGSIPAVLAQYKAQFASTMASLGGSPNSKASLSAIIPEAVCSQIEQAILVLSGGPQAYQAVQLARHIHDLDPHFLGLPFLEQFLKSAMDRREFRAVEELYGHILFLDPTKARSLRKILLARMTQGRAYSAARRVFGVGPAVRYRENRSLHLAQMVDFNLRRPLSKVTLKVARLIKSDPRPSASSYQQAMIIMVNANRRLAAKQLFAHSHGKISNRARSALGNMLLHALIQQRSRGRGRLMRRMLATITALQREQGFVPDRVTVNIVVKALARWPKVVTAKKLQALFDSFIRHGYPVGSRFKDGNMPFGTTVSGKEQVPLLLRGVQGPPHFKKHVRPMYKTFIKAFYLRGDAVAARVVVWILKELGSEDQAKEERREHWKMSRRQSNKGAMVRGPPV